MADIISNLMSPTKQEGQRFDPLTLLPTLLGGFLNIGGNSLLSSQQKSSSKDLMDYQLQKQKDYQQWLLMNQYPMQLQAMRNAGMNPAFANGQNLGTLSASSPNASAGLSQAHLFQMQDALLSSQLNKTNAETKNIEQGTKESQARIDNLNAQTDLLDKQNIVFFDQFKVNMENVISQTNRYNADAKQISKSVEKMDAEIDRIQYEEANLLSSVANNLASAELTGQKAKYYEQEIKSVIQNNMAQAALAFGENYRRGEKLMYEIFNLSALSSYYDNQANLLDVNKKMQDFMLEQEKRFNTGKQVAEIFGNVTSSVAQVVSSIKGFGFAPYSVQNGQMNPYTPITIKGFGN